MKKIAALMLALVIAIAAIGCSAPADQNQDNTPANDNKEPYRVAMVTDTGGINDQSFNASAWAGLQRAQEELGCEVKYFESKTTPTMPPTSRPLLTKVMTLSCASAS